MNIFCYNIKMPINVALRSESRTLVFSSLPLCLPLYSLCDVLCLGACQCQPDWWPVLLDKISLNSL